MIVTLEVIKIASASYLCATGSHRHTNTLETKNIQIYCSILSVFIIFLMFACLKSTRTKYKEQYTSIPIYTCKKINFILPKRRRFRLPAEVAIKDGINIVYLYLFHFFLYFIVDTTVLYLLF